MRAYGVYSAILLVGVLAVATAAGQPRDRQPSDAFLQQQRAIDLNLYNERIKLAPAESLLDWQWGGWIDYYIFDFNDGIQKSRVYQQPGTSVWTRLSIDRGAHEIFARMRLQYEYFNPGDEYDLQQDWNGPNFDRAWYQIDVNRAFHLDEGAPLRTKAKIGRQEVRFGTGYVLDLPLDAALVDLQMSDVRVLGLVGKTIGSYPNVDSSEPVNSTNNRLFYGVQASYEGWQRHVPFAYAIWNNDRSDERPTEFFQNYGYDTQYFGFGARGELTRKLNYWAEGVYESGHSYGDGQWLSDDHVSAFGWDLGLEYLFDGPLRPRVMAEYMFGSGDGGRLDSPTNADGGNRGDRRDTSFVGFGFRDTGIALAPANSNLNIWKAGGSLAPLGQYEFFRDFEMGTNWFVYQKNQASGAISDPTATEPSGWVGWEMDYFVNWRLSSDLSWTVRWGIFFPGSAYVSEEARNFVFSGVTWSF